GLAVAAAAPPWGWWPAAFVGFALLDRAIADRAARSRFRLGWLFAFAWLAPSTIWMFDLTPPGYVASSVFYPLYYGLACAVVPPAAWRRLALPGAITLAEMARASWPFGGVPLSTVAMGQAAGPLAALVRVAGPPLLTVAVVCVGVALSALWSRRIGAVAAAAGAVALAALAAAVAPSGRPIGELSVAVVQGGGPQRTRAASTDPRDVTIAHLAASADVARPVDVVLWPENAVTVTGALADNREQRELASLARSLSATLIPGIVETLPDSFLNASVVFNPSGAVVSRYDKVHRVPFGEYVPLRAVVSPLSGGLVDRAIPREAEPGTGPAVLDTPSGRMAIAISWEVFFDHRAREGVRQGGEVLLNPTNGASYWLTIVQSQQVASSRLRALETGRYVLQAAPTGFSAVISPSGRVLERSAVSERRVLSAVIERRRGLTWSVQTGPWPGLAGAALAVASAHGLARWRRRQGEPAATAPAAG
ncbi:MAG: apolipoprotein N-acyltransferase, partial [Acidimicrobiales bacterium]